MEVQTICVLGAGTMGSGIAQVASQSGYQVVLRDVNEDLLVRGMGNIQRTYSQWFASFDRMEYHTIHMVVLHHLYHPPSTLLQPLSRPTF